MQPPHKVSSPLSPADSNWRKLQRTVTALLGKGYETNLLNAVQSQVSATRFDAVLEYAYNRFLDLTQSQKQILQPIGGGVVTNGASIAATMQTTTTIADDVLALLNDFVDCVQAIKSA